MKIPAKRDFPVEKVRRFLEPGPVLLVSSAWQGETNLMTLGWHTVLEFSPSLVGCMITSANHSFDLIRKSRECVLNLPTTVLAKAVIGVGNCTGGRIDKFKKFGLTPVPATEVGAPLVGECFANFECKLVEAKLVPRYNFFIFEVVKAHVARAPKYPRTLHYRGDGVFMVSGPSVSHRRGFKTRNL